jgi:hypothetical protein
MDCAYRQDGETPRQRYYNGADACYKLMQLLILQWLRSLARYYRMQLVSSRIKRP